MKIKLILSVFLIAAPSWAAEISFTVDDPTTAQSFLHSPLERNEMILDAFDRFKIKGALFVCGMRVNDAEGKALLESWNDRDHLIASHSMYHKNFGKSDWTFEQFQEDFNELEPLISHFKNFTKLFRFPFLKEGDTPDKRNQGRNFLKDKGYRNGHVTIDASDWYVNQRLENFLKNHPKSDVRDLEGYKKFYLNHMWARAQYYDDLAKKVFGRSIKHTILIHHNLLNALFLRDLMKMFEDKGWKLIHAKDAFEDEVFLREPNVWPAGESLVHASARELLEFRQVVRYPGEDGEYEKEAMDKLGL
jgi:hypothetical protein